MASERNGFRQRARWIRDGRGIDKRTLIGMANSLRAELQVIFSERPASIGGLSRELGFDYDRVKYEVKRLRDAGSICVDSKRRVRGTTEVFYRAVSRSCLDDREWPAVPDVFKSELRGSLLDTIMMDAIDAIEEETYDSLEGAHMSRAPGVVDELGWDELRTCLARCLDEVIEILDINRDRLTAEDAKGIAVSVAILGYPSTTPGRAVTKDSRSFQDPRSGGATDDPTRRSSGKKPGHRGQGKSNRRQGKKS